MRIPARRGNRAYSLIEMLVVISIIALLFALIGVVAARARAKGRLSRAKSMLKQIQVGMDAYHALWRDYPSDEAAGFPETWPSPYSIAGVEFDRTFLSDREPGMTFNKGDLDPADDHYVLDPWLSRIRYRKVSTERMLVWSLGPNKVDEIGNDTTKKRERIPPGDATFPNADDISNIESDY